MWANSASPVSCPPLTHRLRAADDSGETDLDRAYCSIVRGSQRHTLMLNLLTGIGLLDPTSTTACSFGFATFVNAMNPVFEYVLVSFQPWVLDESA